MRERWNREEKQGEERKKGNRKLSILLLLLLLLFVACLGVGGYTVIKNYVDKENGGSGNKPVDITVTLELNGGQLSNAVEIAGLVIGEDGVVTKRLQEVEVYGELPNVTKENNNFEGWFTALDETGIKVESGTRLLKTENHTLYAKFSPTECKYNIIFKDMEDNRQLAKIITNTVKKGDVVNITAPDIIGYTLKTSAEELSVQILENNKDIEVLYERNTYRIKYAMDLNAEDTLTHSEVTTFRYSKWDTVQATLKAYDELYLMDSNFALTGYGFKNWSINGIELKDKDSITLSNMQDLGFSLNLKKNPADTIILKANFVPSNYSLIFMASLTSKATTQNLAYKAHPKLTSAVTNVEKQGYVFKGWYEESTGETGTEIAGKTPIDLLTYEMPAQDTTLYAGFELETYTLTINTNGGTLEAEVAGTFTIESNFEVPKCTKVGYIFEGYEDGIVPNPTYSYRIKNRIGNITLTANYRLERYSINILREDGLGLYESVETMAYTIESEDITITNADGKYNKEGYTFAGFSGTDLEGEDNETITVAKGSTGDKYFYLHYEVVTYNLTYLNADGTPLTGVENPITYTIETEDFKLNNPDRTAEGYIFEGWSINGDIVIGTDISVTKGSIGDKVFKAHFIVKVFNLTLQLNGGTLEEGESESKEFNVETESFNLPTKVAKKGYTFIGWTSAISNTPTLSIEVAKGTIGNLLFMANYEAIRYRISYDYAGGAKQQYGEYNESYTIEDEVTPDRAVKTGYIFVTWNVYEVDEMGNETIMDNVHFIEKGSTGNKKFVAVYTPDTGTIYTVNHYIENLDGTFELKEKQELKGETETEVTPEVNKYSGFNSPDKITKVIQADGLTTINYYYIRASYEVTVITNNYIEPIETKAYKYEEKVTLKAVVNNGYKFMGWSEVTSTNINIGMPDSFEISFTMPSANVTMRANASELTYSITLDYGYNDENGQRKKEEKAYTYFTNDITIEDPTRQGYEFLGWSGSDIDPTSGYRKNLVIPKGSQNPKEYLANWKAIVYTLIYELNGGELDSGSNPSSYTIETATFTLLNPSKAGYDFIGWKLEETGVVAKTVKIAKGSIGNKTYTATYEAKKVEYKVIHKFMTVDGATYEDHQVSVYNDKCVDENVVATLLTGEEIRGFTAPEQQSIKLNADSDKNVVTYYYTRNKYKVNVTATNGIESVEGSGEYYYQQEATIKAVARKGYDFAKFTMGGVDYEYSTEMSITVRDENVEIVAYANIINYRIEIRLNGGSLASGESLASGFTLDEANGIIVGTYTVESNTITISYELNKYGYKFLGYKGTELSGEVKSITIGKGSTEDRIYTAQFEAIRYYITYNLGEGASVEGANPAYYTIETETFTIINPKKIGYTFTGWSGTGLTGEENKEITIVKGSLTEDLEYTAHYVANIYRVNFNYNNATVGVEKEYIDVEYNTAYGALPMPEKKGYTFIGWYIMNAQGEPEEFKINESSVMNKAENHTLIAVFLGAKYSLTLDYMTGKSVVDVYYDSPLPVIEKPTRLGYTFKGYYTQQNAGGELYYNEDVVAQKARYLEDNDSTLFAYWERNKYNVILDKQNGTGGTDSVTASWYRPMPNKDITAPTRVGYTFMGYYDIQFGQGKKYYTNEMKSANNWDKDVDNVTLYAYWTANSYTVTLERGGSATGTSNVTTVYDSDMPNAEAPYIVGKIFKGYYGEEGGNGTKYYDLASQLCGERNKAMASSHIWDVAENTVIYAYYVTRYYMVIFSQEEATTQGTLSTSEVTYGSAMPSGLMAPQRIGYTFMGYYTGANGTGVKYYDGAMSSVRSWDIDEDTTTLYAHWQANKYTLTLKCNENGATPQSRTVTVTYDAMVPNITIPVYKGYTFVTYVMATSDGEVSLCDRTGAGAVSWTFAQDMTANAKWIKNYYIVTLNKQNGTGGTDSITLGYTDSLPSATAPTREDYNFKGYFTGTNGNGTKYYSETMADSLTGGYPYDYGITLYAYWTPITIKLEVLNTTNLYYINGALYERSSSTMYKCTYGTHYSTSYSTSTTGCPDHNHNSGSKYYYCNHSDCKRWYSNDRHAYDSYTYSYTYDCGSCGGTGSQSCKACNGSGASTIIETYNCTKCGGSGKVTTTTTTYGGHHWDWTDSVSGGRYKCSYCGKQYGAVGPPASDTECKGNKQTVETTTDCGSCSGTGKVTNTTHEPCPNCDGSGSISCSSCNGKGTKTGWDTDYYYHNATSNGGYSKYKCKTCGQYTEYNESGCKHSYTEACYKYTLKYGTGTDVIYKGTSEAQYLTGYYWHSTYGALKDVSGNNEFTYVLDGKVYYVNRFKQSGSTYYLYAQRKGTPKITDTNIDKYL